MTSFPAKIMRTYESSSPDQSEHLFCFPLRPFAFVITQFSSILFRIMSNPFLILADSTPSPYSTATSKAMPTTGNSPDFYKDLLESILLCTVDEQPTSSAVVYLADLAGALPNTWDNNLVDQALFERLRMSDPSAQLVTRASPSTRNAAAGVAENRCLVYLAGCYQRLLQQRVSRRAIRAMRHSSICA